MHIDEINRTVEGFFSRGEEESKLTGEQTRDIVLAVLTALITALSKRAVTGKTSGATILSSENYRVLNLGLERTLLHCLYELQSHLIRFDVQEVEE